ncbi:hypothetical protein EYC58_03425 [Candidatus Saccharibacteria bacterium]|nr:MAG: hypothetical protein EYC58_03425 [Candidatus Saccharibacteria bacterium]
MVEAIHFLGMPIDSDEDYSLTVVHSAGSVLLGEKTRGFGNGKFVLPGGKDQYYLSQQGVHVVGPVDCAVREAAQETGVSVSREAVRQVGFLRLTDEQSENTQVRIFMSTVAHQVGLHDTGELKNLHWRSEPDIPYGEMPYDYRLWLPRVLAGCVVNLFLDTDGGKVIGGKGYCQELEPLGRMKAFSVPAESKH